MRTTVKAVFIVIIVILIVGYFFYIPQKTEQPTAQNIEQENLSECQRYYKYEFTKATVYGTFEQYPVTDVYTGPIATVNEDSGAAAKRFYTHHKIALEKGVNFAGKYAISDWGFTGVGQMFAVVDVETGDVYPFPYAVSWEFDFRSDSNLIVINPIETVPDFADGGDFDCEYPLHSHLVTYYFLFEDGEFTLLGPEDMSGLRTDWRLEN